MFVLVLQLYLWSCTSFVMPIFGDSLVHPPPCRPSQQLGNGLLYRQHKPPEEPSNLRQTQWDNSPRNALNRARVLDVGRETPFLHIPSDLVVDPTFKGSECPCRFFRLRALRTTKSRGPRRHRL